MVDFNPIEYSFDKVGYVRAEKEAKEKLEALDKMLVWSANHNVHIKTKKDMGMFAVDPVNHFKYLWFEKNSKKIDLKINVDKLLELTDINIGELISLKNKYERIRSEVGIVDDKKTKLFKYSVTVDRKRFARFTTSEEQNKKVRALQKFIKEIEKIDKDICKVYPFEMCRAVGQTNFLRFNTSEGKYEIILS